MDENCDDMSSATTVGPVVLDDEGTTAVLRMVEAGGSHELAPAVSPIPTSDDESEDSTRGDVGMDTRNGGYSWSRLSWLWLRSHGNFSEVINVLVTPHTRLHLHQVGNRPMTLPHCAR